LGEKTWLIIIKLNFVERVQVLVMLKWTIGIVRSQLLKHGDILEAGNDSCRFKQQKKAA